MKNQHKTWRNEWRQIMGKPIDIEIEPDCDFDLHFDIWSLEKDKFFKLFERFPRGLKIAEQAYQLRWGDLGNLNKKLTEEELLHEVKNAIELLQKIQPSEDLTNPRITFIRGNDEQRIEVLSETEPLSIEVDDEFSAFVNDATGEDGYNTFFFLSEPMYRMSSSYIPRNWILWALTDYEVLNPYTPILKLYYNDCDVALSDDGVILFQLN